METETMIYEDILPKLEEAASARTTTARHSEYTRNGG